MKIITVIGARPQFIKAAAVSRLFTRAAGVEEILVHTGQHYDENMSDVFFQELNIPAPKHHLGIGSGSHGAQTGRMLEAIEKVLLQEKPDVMLIYGDTNSTLAGALAAAKLHIPVAHVEAGLRSFNRKMPEEINRVVADHLSAMLFAPTDAAVDNLAREGISSERVHLVGDVMYDAAVHFGARAGDGILAKLGLKPRGYVLATLHRAENTDDPQRLSCIFEALTELAQQVPVVLPLHPRTRAALQKVTSGTWRVASDISSLAVGHSSLLLLAPLGYLDMLALERHARLIATDSGGVQKEAFFQRVPCVTLRDETEWVELIECGWNRLLPPISRDAVSAGLSEALRTPRPAEPLANLYGGGEASWHIFQLLASQSTARSQAA